MIPDGQAGPQNDLGIRSVVHLDLRGQDVMDDPGDSGFRSAVDLGAGMNDGGGGALCRRFGHPLADVRVQRFEARCEAAKEDPDQVVSEFLEADTLLAEAEMVAGKRWVELIY